MTHLTVRIQKEEAFPLLWLNNEIILQDRVLLTISILIERKD
jgi:hypothetical protein